MRRHIGKEDLSSLPADVQNFIKAIDETYTHFDEDRALAVRSLELSSRELDQANSVLHSTFEATVQGIIVADRDQNVLLYNKRFVQLWGIPYDLMAARNVDQVAKFISRQLTNPDEFLTGLKTIRAQKTTTFDTLECTDGRVLERIVHPLIVDDKVTGRVVALTDITEKITSEKALKIRSLELEKMNRLMIDREIKMVELKKELKKYKASPEGKPTPKRTAPKTVR